MQQMQGWKSVLSHGHWRGTMKFVDLLELGGGQGEGFEG